VIEFLKEHKKITSKKYADLFGIIDRMARNDLSSKYIGSGLDF